MFNTMLVAAKRINPNDVLKFSGKKYRVLAARRLSETNVTLTLVSLKGNVRMAVCVDKNHPIKIHLKK